MKLHRMMLDESSITISSERLVRVFSGKLPRYFITKHVMPCVPLGFRRDRRLSGISGNAGKH